MKNVIIASIISAIFSVSAVFAAAPADHQVKKPVADAAVSNTTDATTQDDASNKEGTEEVKK